MCPRQALALYSEGSQRLLCVPSHLVTWSRSVVFRTYITLGSAVVAVFGFHTLRISNINSLKGILTLSWHLIALSS